MAKEEKILRVNVPFRVLPETLSLLDKLAEKHKRPRANMLEFLVEAAAERDLLKKDVELIKRAAKG